MKIGPNLLIHRRQRFLLSMVGDGPDALSKANELAQKFEQHIFSSTTTKVSRGLVDK